MQNNFHLISLLVATLWATNPIAVGAQQKNSSGFEHVHSLAMDSGGQALFLGAHTGLYRSDDRGRTWNKVPVSTTQPHLDVMDIAADTREPKTVYVGTHEAGVFKSIDGGLSWNQVNDGLKGMDVHGLRSIQMLRQNCTWSSEKKAMEFIGAQMAAENGRE
jgi:photosystem II stability/assembly factor-like uncharacterized protein